MKEIVHDYKPREIFRNFHQRTQRWAINVVHRRGGKTVATVNDTISRILYFQAPTLNDGTIAREPGRFAYVAPFLNQARQIAWDYVKRYSSGMTKKISEAELSCTYFNDCKLTLYGADNPDAFRGIYLDGVDLDEYGLMKPSVWSEVLLPTLIDRRGWATFIGTPNGPNHFRTLVRNAQQDPQRWFYERHPVSETKLIAEEELYEMRKLMLPEEYEQEMECSFEASARGAFYSAELTAAEAAGHITPLLANEDMPLHFIFDLGFTDDTALIAFQDATDGYPIIHAESDNLRPIHYYIKRIHDICDLYGCERGVVWLPHDVRAKTLQTGRSIVEQFLDSGIRPQIVPNLDKLDGIAAARLLFPEVYFNAEAGAISGPCAELVEALKTYRRRWDEDTKAFSKEPIHDWSSHYADVFRYFALVARKEAPTKLPLSPNYQRTPAGLIVPKQLTHYPFSLDDLFKENEHGARAHRIQ